MMMLNPIMRHMNHWEVAPRKGGGGSSDSTTTSSSKTVIDDQFRPHVDQGLADLKSVYDSGGLGMVAGASDLQLEAFEEASGSANLGLDVIEESRGTYRDAMSGQGMFDPAQIGDLERAAIDQASRERGVMNDNMASSGLLGGSRSAIAAGDQDAQLSNALAGLKYDQLNKTQERSMWGAESLSASGNQEADLFTQNIRNIGELGGVQRGIEQEYLDADAKGLENYLAGMQTFMPIMSSTEQTSDTKQKSKSGGK
jgi:hypothetical protein